MNDDLYLETLEVKYLSEGLDDEEMEWIFKQAKRNQSLEKWSKKQTERVHELEDELIVQKEHFEELQNNHIRVCNQNKRYREVIEYVMTAKSTHYSSLENALEDIKYVINEVLERDSE